ncbi:MAG: hypothetical protein KUG65_11795 [Sphingomonadaceae bacterium]|nr:hypothetical protein [Sphingomonadaceae bacterium]
MPVQLWASDLPDCRLFNKLEELALAPQGMDDKAATRMWTETETILSQTASVEAP